MSKCDVGLLSFLPSDESSSGVILFILNIVCVRARTNGTAEAIRIVIEQFLAVAIQV